MKNEPKIRIKGFEGEWKEYSFNNLFSLVSDYKSNIGNKTDYQEEGKYPIIDQSKEYIVGYTNEDNPIIPDNGIIVFGDHTREIKYIDFPFYTGADGTKLLHCQESVFPLFGYYSCCSQRIPNTGYNRHYKFLKEADYIIPSLTEQRAIATYFRHIDSLMESADKKVASLKQVKEASLQSMFPKEGQKVPEVRFKGFEGEWKNCILSDIATFSKGHGYSKNDLTNEKDATPIILYGRMYTKYESIITRVETFANLLPNSVLSEGHEVIVPGSGETAEDISVASAICTKGIIIGGDLNILKPKEGIFAPFLALNITYSHAHYELSTKAQGKTIVHLHNDDFKDVHVSCPSLPEQRKIASFFVHIDKQIAIAQQRLDLLRRIKSACLNEMFV